jgi:hypothetical protein
MNNFLFNFLIEIGLFTLLGLLYYFYQKKKITRYEADKPYIIMGQILQSCLVLRGDTPHATLDPLIEEIDDFMREQKIQAPLESLRKFSQSSECSDDLRAVIIEGLRELET